MEQEWGSLFYDTTAPIVDALRNWYYTSGNEQQGDIACVDFKYVHCVDGTFIDYSQLNPYDDALFLFYTARPIMATIRVLGFASWDTVVSKGGHLLQSDLVRTRSFIPTWSEPTRVSKPDGVFWWPVQLPRSHAHIVANADRVTCNRDEIAERVGWYLSEGRAHVPAGVWKPNEASIVMALGVVGAAMEDIFSIPDTEFDTSLHHARFNRVRLRLERERFQQACAHYLVTEANVLRAFIDNGLEEYMNDIMIADPTPLDLQWFYRRWPQCARPTICFLVPMEEIPLELVCHMPVHPLGLAHITYKEVPHWLWCVFSIQLQKPPALNPTFIDEGMLEQARRCATYYAHAPAERRQYRGNVVSAPEVPIVLGPTVGSHKLSAFVPACIKLIMDARRFPKHMERLRMISIFKEAGLSREDVFAWFEAKNDSCPHETIKYASASDRFNYTSAWDNCKGPHYCGNIVNQTLEGMHDVILCPFASGTDAKRNTAECKQKCNQGDTSFAGPFDLIRRAIASSLVPANTMATATQSNSN